MAETVEKSPVSVGTSDSLTKAVVTFVIPELKVDAFLGHFRSGKPKNGKQDIKFESRSLDFNLEVTVNKRVIKYTHIVSKLPGEIVPEDCDIKFYNGKVVVMLAKANEESWEASLAANGLDLQ